MAAQVTKQQIVGSARKRVTVTVPQWGGDVTLQRMGALDYWQMKKRGATIDWEDPVAVLAFSLDYICLCLVDAESGLPMFDAEDLGDLQRAEPETIDRLFSETLKLNGVRPEAIEDVEKNSEPTASCDGGSDSPGSADTRTQTTCSPS